MQCGFIDKMQSGNIISEYGKAMYKHCNDVVFFCALSSKNDCGRVSITDYEQTRSTASWSCSFTGNAPREGNRTPMSSVKYSEDRDEETGYGYFGARYMGYELMTMWLSVDPMADKYPSISPYAYCAWNPMKLADPNGMEVYIVGSQSEKTVSLLQTKKLSITRDDQTGKLSVAFREGYSLEDLSVEELSIYNAIDDNDICIQVTAEKSGIENGRHWYRSRDDDKKYETFGGSFDGSEFINENGQKRAVTYCYMDVDLLDELGYNQGVPHEISEQFLLGQKTLELERSIPKADKRYENPEYYECHWKAIPEKSGWFNWHSLGIHIPPSIFGQE